MSSNQSEESCFRNRGFTSTVLAALMACAANAAPVWELDPASTVVQNTGGCASDHTPMCLPLPLPPFPICSNDTSTGLGPSPFGGVQGFSYAHERFNTFTCPSSGTGLSFIHVTGLGTAKVRIRWLIDSRSFLAREGDIPAVVYNNSGDADIAAALGLTIVDPAQPSGTPQPVDYLWAAFSFNNYKPEAGADDNASVIQTNLTVDGTLVWDPPWPPNFFDLNNINGFRAPPAGTANFMSSIDATVPVQLDAVTRATVDNPPDPPGSPGWVSDQANTVFLGQLILSLDGPVSGSASCEEPIATCPPGATGDCFTDHPSAGCQDSTCCALVCQIDPACCIGSWTFDCAEIAQTICPVGAPACVPGGSPFPCNSPHPGPGCSEPLCCNLICSFDTSCCDVEWVQGCADLALVLCDDCCPDLASQEAEGCGATTNDGCFMPVPQFEQTFCGDVICGTAWADGGQRDTDWYRLSVVDTDGDGQAQITAELNSEFTATLFIVDTLCFPVTYYAAADSSLGATGTASACVPAPGTYHIIVAPGTLAGGPILLGNPCGGTNDYVLTVDCAEPCPVIPPPPHNDCANALPIFNGDTSIDTTGATLDGPATCSPIGADVWYKYIATCTGTLKLSTCNQAGFDTILVVYDGTNCPADPTLELGCNDDSTPLCLALTSYLEVPVVAGQSYLVRVGGGASATGTGTLTLACSPACVWDLNGNGIVNGIDLAILLGSWTGTAVYAPCPRFAAADLNQDCKINGLDLALLLGAWGPCP